MFGVPTGNPKLYIPVAPPDFQFAKAAKTEESKRAATLMLKGQVVDARAMFYAKAD